MYFVCRDQLIIFIKTYIQGSQTDKVVDKQNLELKNTLSLNT